MPSFDEDIILTQSRDTPVTITGPNAGPALINGPLIQDAKVRYIWKIRAFNPNVGAHDLIIYAADAANTQRRIIFRTQIPALGTLDYPLGGEPDQPILRVPPVTAIGVVTQENAIYTADEGAGGLITNVSMSYYEKRG